MAIKEKRHPQAMIDMTIVPYSRLATNTIKKMCGLPLDHHVLVVDLGETESSNPSDNSRTIQSVIKCPIHKFGLLMSDKEGWCHLCEKWYKTD